MHNGHAEVDLHEEPAFEAGPHEGDYLSCMVPLDPCFHDFFKNEL